MYGLVNKAVRDLICSQHGEATWDAIRRRANVLDSSFVCMEQYPDAVTYQLVAAASEELGASPEQILQAFGKWWITYTVDEGYGSLVEMYGSDLPTFLGNLDHMHSRVSLSFPNLNPPQFDLEDLRGGKYRLHYYSERPGLAPMILGLIEGLCVRFQTSAEVIIDMDQSEEGHTVFQIQMEPVPV